MLKFKKEKEISFYSQYFCSCACFSVKKTKEDANNHRPILKLKKVSHPKLKEMQKFFKRRILFILLA